VVGRDLLAFWEDEFYFFFVEDEDFFVPGLIDFADDYFADFVFVFLEDEGFFVVLDFAYEVLVNGEYFAAAEFAERYGFGEVFAHFEVGFDLNGLRIFDFAFVVGELAVLDDVAVAVDFEVAFVDVHDDVEVVVGAVAFGECGAEHLFEDMHERFTVNVLVVFKFREGINKV